MFHFPNALVDFCHTKEGLRNNLFIPHSNLPYLEHPIPGASHTWSLSLIPGASHTWSLSYLDPPIKREPEAFNLGQAEVDPEIVIQLLEILVQLRVAGAREAQLY